MTVQYVHDMDLHEEPGEHLNADFAVAVVAVEDLGDALMGAKDVAEALGIHVPNLKHVKIEPVARISGGRIPVYLASDVEQWKREKAARVAS